MNRKFKKIISVLMVFLIVLPILSVVRAENNVEHEARLIADLYDDLYRMTPVGGEWDIEIPSAIIQCAREGAVQRGDLDEKKCIGECTKDFAILIRKLCDHNFNENNYMDVIRIVSAVSAACIVYSANYVNLAKHMIYLLNRFGGHSAMLKKLFRGDPVWREPLKSMCSDVGVLLYRIGRLSELPF